MAKKRNKAGNSSKQAAAVMLFGHPKDIRNAIIEQTSVYVMQIGLGKMTWPLSDLITDLEAPSCCDFDYVTSFANSQILAEI